MARNGQPSQRKDFKTGTVISYRSSLDHGSKSGVGTG